LFPAVFLLGLLHFDSITPDTLYLCICYFKFHFWMILSLQKSCKHGAEFPHGKSAFPRYMFEKGCSHSWLALIWNSSSWSGCGSVLPFGLALALACPPHSQAGGRGLQQWLSLLAYNKRA
jgi:hypothetical protein